MNYSRLILGFGFASICCIPYIDPAFRADHSEIGTACRALHPALNPVCVSCLRGNLAGCSNAIAEIHSGLYGPQPWRVYTYLLSRMCLARDGLGCVLLSYEVLQSYDAMDTSCALARRACEHERGSGCTALGVCEMAMPDKVSDWNPYRHFRLGCAMDDPVGCRFALDDPRLDAESLLRYTERACRQMGSRSTCMEWSARKILGLNVALDPEGALNFLRDACVHGSGLACAAERGYLPGVPVSLLEATWDKSVMFALPSHGPVAENVTGYCIDRDGRVRDVTTLSSSGIPRLDAAFARSVAQLTPSARLVELVGKGLWPIRTQNPPIREVVAQRVRYPLVRLSTRNLPEKVAQELGVSLRAHLGDLVIQLSEGDPSVEDRPVIDLHVEVVDDQFLTVAWSCAECSNWPTFRQKIYPEERATIVDIVVGVVRHQVVPHDEEIRIESTPIEVDNNNEDRGLCLAVSFSFAKYSINWRGDPVYRFNERFGRRLANPVNDFESFADSTEEAY